MIIIIKGGWFLNKDKAKMFLFSKHISTDSLPSLKNSIIFFLKKIEVAVQFSLSQIEYN